MGLAGCVCACVCVLQQQQQYEERAQQRLDAHTRLAPMCTARPAQQLRPLADQRQCSTPLSATAHLVSLRTSQVRETQHSVRDGQTGHASMTLARGIGERVRLLLQL